MNKVIKYPSFDELVDVGTCLKELFVNNVQISVFREIYSNFSAFGQVCVSW